ncbi:Capsular glucan synthase [Janthinobacterium lividum]|uniref:glycosyltransferase family 4 protein n=1 Tax=Janthinobacterium lividum TaxID=29581 RepID=UPI000E047055|nr:glycosyltransferase family 4 protein [Janthinobacterium lividum]STR26008.1 Capsular glucan synthase [Janthinobacterium lividum]
MISNQAFSIINFRGPLVAEMIKRGCTVYALAPDYDDGNRAAVAALGAIPIDYSMSRAGMNPVRDAMDLFKLAFLLRKLKPDASFTYFIKPVIYGTLAARLAGISKRYAMIEGAGYVFIEDTASNWRRKLLRAFATGLYRLGLSQANRVFMLNADDKELFVSEKMVCAGKVQLLDGIGLDLNHYRMTAPASQPFTFILVARLLREKGIYEYVEAARKIKARHPDIRFILLGSIDLNPGSVDEATVHEWVAEGTIEWPGQVSDVREWIAQASVFVLPSYREGLPRSTQEAMAMGRPVITTDVPGCRDTVSDGINGYMVPARNAVALSNAMLKLIEHPELLAPMGERGRHMAEEKFDVHKINAVILQAMDIPHK